jgi:uncharacterized protein (DUF697 family)
MKRIYAQNEFKGLIKKLPIVGGVVAAKALPKAAQIAARAARLSKAMKVPLPSTKHMIQLSKLAAKTGAAPISSVVGLTAVGGAAALGYAAIRGAKKKFDKQMVETNKAIEGANKSGRDMRTYLMREKYRTGMNMQERRAKRMKDQEDADMKKMQGLNSVFSPEEEKEYQKKNKSKGKNTVVGNVSRGLR